MFTITSRDVLVQIEENGSARITYKVDGFWSSEQLTVYIDRRWGNGWRITYSNSTGGRDTDSGLTDSEACYNFGKAMMDASDKMDYWTSNIETLDIALAKYNTDMKARYAEEARIREEQRKAAAIEQAKKEAVDAPHKIGGREAHYMLEELASGKFTRIVVRPMGEEASIGSWGRVTNGKMISCRTGSTGRKSYYIGEDFIAKNKLESMIANMVEVYCELPWNYFAK